MDKADIKLLMDFNDWANARVLKACRDLTDDQLRVPMNCSFGNVMGTLVHIYGTEMVWRKRMHEGLSPDKIPAEEDFASLADLEAAWESERALMHDFVDGLKPEDVERWVEYQSTKGQAQASTLWKALAQVAFHGAQFRAEAGAVMAVMGQSPGDLDFVLYIREIDQR